MSDPSHEVLLIRALSPSLGKQKAEALVWAAIQGLNFNRDALTSTEARAVLAKIAEESGLVGAVGRGLLGGGSGQGGAP